MPLVLLVDDDPTVRGAIAHTLTDLGHAVRAVGSAMEALQEITRNQPDLVILDLGLPDIDGADALRMLRTICDVPVIVATGRRGELDIIRLLNAGADDYVVKPFSTAHLAARVTAVLRRGRPAAPERSSEPVRVGGLCVDPSRRTLTLDGEVLKLTRKEYELLAYLAGRAGQVVTRKELVTEVWRAPYAGFEKTLDVHISWLRRKLGETAAQPRLLHAVRGVGIMLADHS